MRFLKKSLKLLIIIIFLSIFSITGIYLYAKSRPKLDINKSKPKPNKNTQNKVKDPTKLMKSKQFGTKNNSKIGKKYDRKK